MPTALYELLKETADKYQQMIDSGNVPGAVKIRLTEIKSEIRSFQRVPDPRACWKGLNCTCYPPAH